MAQCPNCGTALTAQLQAAQMVTCDACQSTVYVLDERLVTAGSAGVMHDAPTLVQLGDVVRIDGATYDVLGHARFSYGPGWWDEFWLRPVGGAAPQVHWMIADESDAAQGGWLIADEGDIALQYPITAPEDAAQLSGAIGDEIHWSRSRYTLTEADRGECIALRGSFPDQMAVGDSYSYVNLTSTSGKLLSRERHAGQDQWFAGAWIDPFSVQLDVGQV